MPKLSKDKRDCHQAHKEFEKERYIYGLNINVIPNPPEPYAIDNYGLPIKKRKFKPLDLPKVGVIRDKEDFIIFSYFSGLTTQEEALQVAEGVDGADIGEEEKALIRKIIDYRINGYFFYNKDKLEYITGDHWYMLNLMKVDVVGEVFGIQSRVKGHPKFIDAQRDVYLHWQQCVEDKRSYGQLLITRRRFAKTTFGSTVLLNHATLFPRAKCGIQAQNRDGARDIFGKIVDMWRNLPKHPILYPTHSGEDNPATILSFREQRKSGKGSARAVIEDVLDSWIDFRATKVAAYDGSGLSRYYLDEASKNEECSLLELFNVVRETLVVGTTKVGKMMVTSTAENIGGKTLDQFVKLWDDSQLSTKDSSPLNETSSGLYPLFIPADYGYTHSKDDSGDIPEDLNKDTIDEWGYSDRETARKVILAARKNKSGATLIEYIRKYPLTIEEAFTYGVSRSPLPLDIIQEQRMFNHQVFRITNPLVRGEFIWDMKEGEKPKVRFIENENALFEINPKVKPEDLNCVRRGSLGFEPTRDMCKTGIDPFDHKITERGDFSKAAAVTICSDPKYFLKPTVIAVYHGRPDDPRILFESMLKMCVYFSSMAYIENQKPGCVNYFVDEGFSGYLGSDPFNPTSKTPGISMADLKKRSVLVDRLIAFIKDNVGLIDYANNIYSEHFFERLLKDWYNFNPGNEAWTKYDLSVATLLALVPEEESGYEQVEWKITDWF